MDKAYNHSKYEDHLYKLWEESNAFTPKKETGVKPFTIIMPPPNANDPLHVGHAMFVTIEDILTRYHRMKGEAAEWLPGTDHAGIETQFVFEKKLAKEDKSRFDFDRETLYKKIWDYVNANSDVAVNQMKKLGASADWSRFTFTLDPKVVDFVYNTFSKLHTDQLIYRAEKLVNYCTKCGTGYSELEVDHIEENTKLYFIKYGPFTLATTRPETKFADTAVAVNPSDSRYKEYVGKEIEVEGLLGNFKLKVISDDYVDPKFGTGVVKITPFHDPNDYEVWLRHKEEIPEPKQVIGLDGKLTEVAGKYKGLKVKIAREQIVKDLEEKGLLVKVQDYTHNIGVCYRCGTVIEPLPLPQFFLKVQSLALKVTESLDRKDVKIHGTGREKILRDWLTNLKDWNISRQIVWGIRIPVWYDAHKNPNIYVSFINSKEEKIKGTLKELLDNYSLSEISKGIQTLTAPKDSAFVVSKTSPGDIFIQETDTFDTWFSSGQWPVVTLKIRGDDFDYFYPTSVMETGYDILPIWVLRMLLLGIYLTNTVPFKDVYLHGLVRDEKGLKMSKSKGNVINPLDMVVKYGADAVRMALVMSSTPGQDKSVGEQTIKGMRNFSNKIWNATRYVQMLLSEDKKTENRVDLNDEFTKELDNIIKEVTNNLDKLRVGLACEIVYDKFWHWYCDWAIEQSKAGSISKENLKKGLLTFLTLLHPFTPFVTEASYQEVSGDKKMLLISSRWPN